MSEQQVLPNGIENGGELPRVFLARQPIINWKNDLIGHEILFRSDSTVNAADFASGYIASADVINKVLTTFGINDVLGAYQGFFNIGYEFLLSDKLELLPPEQVTLEILENVPINETVIKRCADLRQRGYKIALDDHLYSPDLQELYELTDIVKVDVLNITAEQLEHSAAELCRRPIIRLAEKVESREMFQRCRELGFNLFQGYFFARPEIMSRESVDTTKLAVMSLLKLVVANAELSEIEEAFKKSPVLIYKLLKLVNSVMVGLKYRVESIRHALSILGLEQLKRWVMLSAFADKEGKSTDNPLFALAATRGKLMESLAEKMGSAKQARQRALPRAFMTGLLSLMPILLHVSVDDLCSELNLDNEIRLALQQQDGLLGQLLLLVQALEVDRRDVAEELAEAVQLCQNDILVAQLETIRWVNALA